MIKLIVSDIDGTMLHDGESEIDPCYFELIEDLNARGIHFCAASGRQYHSLRHLFEPVKDKILYICENGAEVLWQQKEIFCSPMSKEDSEQLVIDTRKIQHAQSVYCTRDMAYFEPKDQDAFSLMSRVYHYRCRMVEDLLSLQEPCIKYSLYLRKNVEPVTDLWFSPKWKKTHDVACGGTYFMDIMNGGVNKGAALNRLQQMLSVTESETAVFGDNINDLEMLDKGSYSFAVANARTAVRRKARYITDTNNRNGVWKAARSILNQYV
ncbi:Cof-type HAD-IIB family hydrolase [Hungatella hathewayi]|uniref:Cof-type HAD-IIB family hydrolase n=1 Tax=Hungatella hathewayi TaxID=154046 RepID=UPI00356B044F